MPLPKPIAEILPTLDVPYLSSEVCASSVYCVKDVKKALVDALMEMIPSMYFNVGASDKPTKVKAFIPQNALMYTIISFGIVGVAAGLAGFFVDFNYKVLIKILIALYWISVVICWYLEAGLTNCLTAVVSWNNPGILAKLAEKTKGSSVTDSNVSDDSKVVLVQVVSDEGLVRFVVSRGYDLHSALVQPLLSLKYGDINTISSTSSLLSRIFTTVLSLIPFLNHYLWSLEKGKSTKWIDIVEPLTSSDCQSVQFPSIAENQLKLYTAIQIAETGVESVKVCEKLVPASANNNKDEATFIVAERPLGRYFEESGKLVFINLRDDLIVLMTEVAKSL